MCTPHFSLQEGRISAEGPGAVHGAEQWDKLTYSSLNRESSSTPRQHREQETEKTDDACITRPKMENRNHTVDHVKV